MNKNTRKIYTENLKIKIRKIKSSKIIYKNY